MTRSDLPLRNPPLRVPPFILYHRRKLVTVVAVFFLGFYFYVLWLCAFRTDLSSDGTFRSPLLTTQQFSHQLKGSRSLTSALVMDSQHIPFPYIVDKNNITSMASAPIVVQLRGEMGNHLSTIAHAIGLQLAALQDHNLSTHLLLRHQTISDRNGKMVDNRKWLPTSHVLKSCFPALRQWDFSVGSQWTEFDRLFERQQQQEQQQQTGDLETGEKMEALALLLQQMSLVNGRAVAWRKEWDDTKEPISAQDIDEGLAAFAKMRRCMIGNKGLSTESSFLTAPFLMSDSMDNMVLMKRYLPVFRQLFRIDPACCGPQQPDPDEAVFHYRNFAKEFSGSMNDTAFKTLPTFEEATPYQAANILFRHLKSGDKVAITSRYADDPALAQFVDAFENKGIQVRVVGGGKTDIEDFCFLLQAREIEGNFRSTFVLWAALLGRAARVVLYTIQSPGLKARFGPFVKTFFSGNTTWELTDDFDSNGVTFEKHLQRLLLPMDGAINNNLRNIQSK